MQLRTSIITDPQGRSGTINNDVLAFFITWTCYGTYLPGDERGWTKWHKGDQLPQPLREDWCRDRMAETAVLLDEAQREIVNQTVHDHCEIRGWTLHAVNCRTNWTAPLCMAE